MVLVIAGWVFITAGRELRAELPSLASRHTAQQWALGNSAPAGRAHWDVVLADLLDAESVQPANPILQEQLGTLYMVAVKQPWSEGKDRDALRDKAAAHFRKAIALRPLDAMHWALLASALSDGGNRGAEFEAATQKALALGPNENHVQIVLMRTALANWTEMPESLKTWADGLYERGTQRQRDALNAMAEPYGWVFSSTQPPRAPRRAAGE